MHDVRLSIIPVPSVLLSLPFMTIKRLIYLYNRKKNCEIYIVW